MSVAREYVGNDTGEHQSTIWWKRFVEEIESIRCLSRRWRYRDNMVREVRIWVVSITALRLKTTRGAGAAQIVVQNLRLRERYELRLAGMVGQTRGVFSSQARSGWVGQGVWLRLPVIDMHPVSMRMMMGDSNLQRSHYFIQRVEGLKLGGDSERGMRR